MANAAWSNPQMWRLAGALNALRRECAKSEALLEGSALARLGREYDSLEHRRKGLVSDAQRITADAQAEHDALIQRILKFYRDVGDLERFAESKRGAS